DFVNAGHEEPVLFVPGGEIQRLRSTGPPLGMPLGMHFEAANVDFAPGALLCAWSDGLPEAHRPDVEPVSFLGDVEPLQEIIGSALAAGRATSLDSLSKAVFERVDDFLDGTHPPDDQTLLLLRRRAPQSASHQAA
ncbi:MAG: PP2C family protein-serine/threonine phosphatase, partial [Candidatus Krumholzibacteriia bacterium]